MLCLDVSTTSSNIRNKLNPQAYLFSNEGYTNMEAETYTITGGFALWRGDRASNLPFGNPGSRLIDGFAYG